MPPCPWQGWECRWAGPWVGMLCQPNSKDTPASGSAGDPVVPGLLSLHNNWIVGKAAKVARQKDAGLWWADPTGMCLTWARPACACPLSTVPGMAGRLVLLWIFWSLRLYLGNSKFHYVSNPFSTDFSRWKQCQCHKALVIFANAWWFLAQKASEKLNK